MCARRVCAPVAHGNGCTLSKGCRIAAAQLQRQGMFHGIKPQMLVLWVQIYDLVVRKTRMNMKVEADRFEGWDSSCVCDGYGAREWLFSNILNIKVGGADHLVAENDCTRCNHLRV